MEQISIIVSVFKGMVGNGRLHGKTGDRMCARNHFHGRVHSTKEQILNYISYWNRKAMESVRSAFNRLLCFSLVWYPPGIADERLVYGERPGRYKDVPSGVNFIQQPHYGPKRKCCTTVWGSPVRECCQNVFFFFHLTGFPVVMDADLF